MIMHLYQKQTMKETIAEKEILPTNTGKHDIVKNFISNNSQKHIQRTRKKTSKHVASGIL